MMASRLPLCILNDSFFVSTGSAELISCLINVTGATDTASQYGGTTNGNVFLAVRLSTSICSYH